MTTNAELEADARAGGDTLASLVKHAQAVQHDLNGSIMVLLTNAEMIEASPTATDATRRQAGRIKLAAGQIEGMTRALLNRIRGKE